MYRTTVRLLVSCLTLLLVPGSCGGGDPAQPVTPVIGIGPAGGTVTSADGNARLVIPAGALSTVTDVAVVPSGAVPLDAKVVKGAAYTITPTLTFASPATLSINYTAINRPGGTAELELSTFSVAGSAFQAVTSTVDAGLHVSTAAVSGSGTYVVRWNGPTGNCSGTEYRQFDFWLGTWAYTAPNSFPGSNTITADPTNCAIYENFTQGQYRGRSVSFFRSADGKWYQTYVDSDGAHDIYSGTFANGVMLLYSSPTTRLSWIKVDDNHIRNVFEQSSDAGATWRVVLDAVYSR